MRAFCAKYCHRIPVPKISVFFAFDLSYKPLHPNLEIIDAQENKVRAWSIDVRTLKSGARKKTRAASIAPNDETNRGGYSAKSFQSRAVSGFTCLIQSDCFTIGKPRMRRLCEN
jgi:hypothetical protein